MASATAAERGYDDTSSLTMCVCVMLLCGENALQVEVLKAPFSIYVLRFFLVSGSADRLVLKSLPNLSTLAHSLTHI